MPVGNQVVLKSATKILQKLGVVDGSMLMTPSKIRKTILSKNEAVKLGYPVGKNDNYHNLGKAGLFKVLNDLNKPVIVIKEKFNKIVVFTEQFDYKNRQIIVPIEINTTSSYNEIRVNNVNAIKFIHGKSAINNYINNLMFKKNSIMIYILGFSIPTTL